MEIMTEQRIRHIPCIAPAAADGTRGAKMEGIVSIGDVVKALLSEEREVRLCITSQSMMRARHVIQPRNKRHVIRARKKHKFDAKLYFEFS